MRFRDGTVWQKALFAALLGFYLFGLLLTAADKFERVGRPDVGWGLDGLACFPSRADVALAGLVAGAQLLQLNGLSLSEVTFEQAPGYVRHGLGEVNRLTVELPWGVISELSIPVQPLTWTDVLALDGPTLALGMLFVVVGLTSFLLRPYTASSWALLALGCAIGSVLQGQALYIAERTVLTTVYFRLTVGFASCVALHGGLAFPVPHPLLSRRPRILLGVYAIGLTIAVLQLAAWASGRVGVFRYVGGGLDTTVLLVSVLFFVGRCCVLAVRGGDPIVTQRARILLAGTVFGVGPVVTVNFLRSALQTVVVDMRLVYWSLTLLLVALGYLTLRHDLLNARIAARRAVIYAGVVGVLTCVAVLLVAVRAYAVAVMLFPLLYWWPRFDARLNAWLYPKRARFPDLMRAIGNELAMAEGVDAVLRILAGAPERLCDARSGVTFLLAGPWAREEQVNGGGSPLALPGGPLADEVLVRVMSTTRRAIFREHLAVEPQYANIQAECYRCFDRLSADVLLPIVHDGRVVGGLAVGPSTAGDPYGTPELDALAAVTQQAMQAIVRVRATEQLRARELEFADLKRFFPPQIIDQVMAKGGAAELRSQRKLVTVFFADLRGFTAFSEIVEPEEVMATLAEYHAAMGRRIAERGGTLERFAGDGFMVFFNDPVEQPDHVERAARMALAMRDDVAQLRAAWLRKGYQIDAGMGIHCGYATCGFIGYEGRRDYGVIGNVTNLAARLSSAATGGEILVTGRIRAELGDGYDAESVGELSLKGFHQPQAVYRLLGCR